MNAKTYDKIWTCILYIIAISVVTLLTVLLGAIIIRGWGFLDFKFLFGKANASEAGSGIGPQLFNSFYLLILSLAITIPLGIGAGIYLSEYAKEGRLLNFIRLCLETMSSLPSIVVGLFGLLIFVNTTKWGFTLIGGALAIAIINLPSLTRVSENAIKAAGKSVKEASLGLGATRWQTIKKVILPSAVPQILTGVILAAGRIFGEAAALIYTAGMSAPSTRIAASMTSKANPFNIFRPAETLAVHIWKLNSEALAPDAKIVAAKSAAVLITMVLIFNIAARILGKKIHSSYTGQK
ncbi:phosphate ABC transporter permease PstA [Clostridium cellulovorans]|uniref:Phosphate transport system permease protein PstA n=1 Tax=Clostridium cellulovorans (strain ATCC 35296 / DSM 3052 / OCM 3 / 743B) TaxID=573061 RepID=D9SL84_CLOC7|nr:phosphate ABC transporter permease PstA [Clostridium cellulovorans]ADL51600.1 phosphate ABC transporter, inner membrane subunit PstA [Clostridium cellulovorans 743B]